MLPSVVLDSVHESRHGGVGPAEVVPQAVVPLLLPLKLNLKRLDVHGVVGEHLGAGLLDLSVEALREPPLPRPQRRAGPRQLLFRQLGPPTQVGLGPLSLRALQLEGSLGRLERGLQSRGSLQGLLRSFGLVAGRGARGDPRNLRLTPRAGAFGGRRRRPVRCGELRLQTRPEGCLGLAKEPGHLLGHLLAHFGLDRLGLGFPKGTSD